MASTRRNVSGWMAAVLVGCAAALVAGAGHRGQPPAPENPPAKEEPGKMTPAPATPENKPATPPKDADPKKTMDELERAAKPKDAAPAVTPAPSTGASTPAVTTTRAAGRLVREGAFLTGKRGRMVRSSEGEWMFVFDSDPNSRAEPSMVLMPCLNLAAMEKVAERTGESASMTISGQVFVYKGKNYLLPSMYQVNRRTDVTPNQ